MSGTKDLDSLLRLMKPKLAEDEFVFCTISKKQLTKLEIEPTCIFRESEGITIIVEKPAADKNLLSYDRIWRMITLTVHSDLAAIGFLAAVANKLAEKKISVNVVSAYYHDHLFVPKRKAERTMEILDEMSSSK